MTRPITARRIVTTIDLTGEPERVEVVDKPDWSAVEPGVMDDGSLIIDGPAYLIPASLQPDQRPYEVHAAPLVLTPAQFVEQAEAAGRSTADHVFRLALAFATDHRHPRPRSFAARAVTAAERALILHRRRGAS